MEGWHRWLGVQTASPRKNVCSPAEVKRFGFKKCVETPPKPFPRSHSDSLRGSKEFVFPVSSSFFMDHSALRFPARAQRAKLWLWKPWWGVSPNGCVPGLDSSQLCMCVKLRSPAAIFYFSKGQEGFMSFIICFYNRGNTAFWWKIQLGKEVCGGQGHLYSSPNPGPSKASSEAELPWARLLASDPSTR